MTYKWSQSPGSWVYDLPLIGDDMSKIGRIQQIYSSPCSPYAEIWVYALFQAIPTLFHSLTKPEAIDINIAHRKGKPRKGKKFKFKGGLVFRDAIIEIPVPRWVCFRVWELSQRIGYYFMVADCTEDFLINWMSTAYKMNGCQLPDLVYGRWEGVHIACGGLGPAGWKAVNTVVAGHSNIELAPGHFGLIRPGQYKVSWSTSFLPYDTPATTALPEGTALFDVNSNDFVPFNTTIEASDGTMQSSNSCTINLENGRGDFQLRARFGQPGLAYCTSQMSVEMVTGDETGPDP